jgi:hypothetical protein
MTEERAYDLFQRAIAESGDPVAADTIYNRAKEDLLRRVGQYPIPRLKIAPEREGKWFLQSSAIYARVGYQTALGWNDSQIKHAIKRDWPMSNDTYYRLIDASSDCKLESNKRLPKAE